MPAGSAAANLHPAGRAVTLYAACGPELAGRRLLVNGRRVAAVRFGRVALLLAYVDPVQYAPSELERRRADAAFLAHEVRIHERAVERASAHGSVLPLHPLTVVTGTNDLEAYAREHAARWTRALTRLGDKREYAVHLYVGPHHVPLAEPYLLRVSGRATRSNRAPAIEARSDIAEHAQSVWGACSALAQSLRAVPSPERRGALWSAALLVAPGDVAPLAEAVERSCAAGAPLGITAYLEGPRAPFTFV
ncbi:MAG: GvpL/GvpF family gas vesicle protein [Candidatus Eremiobacteraeota bacterium]|nr:GvpL/GvpF family gas vesicle protein [Candidatus Eremiobacteraeota bacterium]